MGEVENYSNLCFGEKVLDRPDLQNERQIYVYNVMTSYYTYVHLEFAW